MTSSARSKKTHTSCKKSGSYKVPATALKKLRDWFVANAASLPWRPADLQSLRDPYAVWISEIMLQQTQVATVRDYFTRWMKRFPTVEKLAEAEEPEVFKYWQGLGYYSRARNILKTARTICSSSGEKPAKFPATRRELEALPGIGKYTAGAILSFAFHQPEAILDGNLIRIFSRLYKLNFLPTDSGTSENGENFSDIYWNYSRVFAQGPYAYQHNEALMELGRNVCKVKQPLCSECPLGKICQAYSEDSVSLFPPAKKHIQKDWHGTVLIIESANGNILAVNDGQKFLSGQLALPHFESSRGSTTGLPAQLDNYIDSDLVASFLVKGSFKHSITIHKIECDVLYITLKDSPKAAANQAWIKKAKVRTTFANSFSLKALKLAGL